MHASQQDGQGCNRESAPQTKKPPMPRGNHNQWYLTAMGKPTDDLQSLPHSKVAHGLPLGVAAQSQREKCAMSRIRSGIAIRFTHGTLHPYAPVLERTYGLFANVCSVLQGA